MNVTLDLQNRVGGPWQASNVVAEIRGSGEARARSSCSEPTSTPGTSARGRSTTASTARSWPKWRGRSPRARSRSARSGSCSSASEESGLLGSLGYVRSHRQELDRHVARLHPRHRRRKGRPATSPTAGPDLDAARQGDPRAGRRVGRRRDQRRGDPRNGQLRFPPRGRAQLRRQSGDGALPRRLPRRVRHVRQGGSRARSPQRGRRGGRRSLGLANAPDRLGRPPDARARSTSC